MTDLELKNYKKETYDRLVNAFGMNHEQANFVIALERHTHSTLGAALYEINDFLDSYGL